MNIYAVIILATLLFEYVLNLVADLLNLKALSSDLPKEFKGFYDAEKYLKSIEYTRVNTIFGFISSSFSLIIMLVFWFAGGFQYLDDIVRGLGTGQIITGLVYIAVLILFKMLISLPFSVYSTFVIEERFGFNKTTVKIFISDIIKGVLLGVALGCPLLAGLLAFFQFAGGAAWLYCWIGITLFTLLLQYIAPTWIMPLFNKFEPVKDEKLKDKIIAYAKSVNFRIKDVLIMDGSKRSGKSNAFFTGFGKNKRIALFDTMVAKHTTNELVSILAHEIGHYKKKHIQKMMMINILHTGVIFFLLSIFISNKGLFDAFYVQNVSIYAGMIFFGMLFSPIELILSVFMQISSRRHEYEADRFAVETTKDPDTFVVALKKLVVHNLSNLTPHPFYVFLNYSHPPVLKRIRTISQIFGSFQK